MIKFARRMVLNYLPQAAGASNRDQVGPIADVEAAIGPPVYDGIASAPSSSSTRSSNEQLNDLSFLARSRAEDAILDTDPA
jgi:hypothetical protein